MVITVNKVLPVPDVVVTRTPGPLLCSLYFLAVGLGVSRYYFGGCALFWPAFVIMHHVDRNPNLVRDQ